MPNWVKNAIERWTESAKIASGPIVLLGNFNLSEIMGVAQKSKSDSPSQC
jgi:hypothetical protein